MKDVFKTCKDKAVLVILLIIGSHYPFPLMAQRFNILSQREQAKVTEGWLEHRMEHVLPELMDRTILYM